MLSAPIFNICEVKRIALSILFRFNATADKRHCPHTRIDGQKRQS